MFPSPQGEGLGVGLNQANRGEGSFALANSSDMAQQCKVHRLKEDD